MTATLYVGVDGGATHTRVRVANEDGVTLGEARGERSSLTLGVDAAVGTISKLIDTARGRAFAADAPLAVVCGLAGHRDLARAQRFLAVMAPLGAVELVSDGYAALLGAHAGAPGTLVVAGTGSIGMRLDAGTTTQVGGWGFPIGDEGGGAWIGREAVRLALRAHDEPEADTRFLADIRLRCGGGHSDILAWLSEASATQFAALAPHVVAAAPDDANAADILRRAGRELERLAVLLDAAGEHPVSLVGGLAEPLQPYLPDRLRARLTPPKADALEGALLRARGLAPPEVVVDAYIE